MARARLFEVALETNADGDVIGVLGGASGYVYESDGTTPFAQVMYAGPTGGATLANPLTANVLGEFLAYTDPARDATLSINGGAVKPVEFEQNATALGLLDISVQRLKGAYWYPKEYGAVADGESHPLSETYGTLAEAQAAFGGALAGIVSDLAEEIDRAAVHYCAYLASTNGGGTVFCHGGDYLIDRTVNQIGYSDVEITGVMMDATNFVVTATMDGRDTYGNGDDSATYRTKAAAAVAGYSRGSNQHFANSVFASINNIHASDPLLSNAPSGTTGVAQDPATHLPLLGYVRNLRYSNFTIDCALQSQENGPTVSGGWNACGIELQDVDFGVVSAVKIKAAAGNAIVMSSVDPGMHAATQGGEIIGNWLEDCCRVALTSYGGNTGSVIQYGAMKLGRVEGNYILRPGNPWLDIFNCEGTQVRGNYCEGMLAATLSTSTYVGYIHSDFGLVNCTIENNVSKDSGGIAVLGMGRPQYENDFLSTAGPIDTTIVGNKISGTAKFQVAAPFGIATGWNATSASVGSYPLGVTLIFGSATTITSILVNGATVWSGSYAGASASATSDSFNFVVPAGGTFRVNGSGDTPTAAWYRMPNGSTPAIKVLGGSWLVGASPNASNVPKVAKRVTVRDNKLTNVAAVGIQLYDTQDSHILGNDIVEPGFWDIAAAYGIQLRSTRTYVTSANESLSTRNEVAGNVVSIESAFAKRRLRASLHDPGSGGEHNLGAENTQRGNRFAVGREGSIKAGNQPGMPIAAAAPTVTSGTTYENRPTTTVAGGTTGLGTSGVVYLQTVTGTGITEIMVNGEATGATTDTEASFQIPPGSTYKVTHGGAAVFRLLAA